MFGEQVRRIFFSKDLLQVYPFAPDGVLHPQSMSVDVPQFAQSLAGAYAYRRGGVRPDSQRKAEADAIEERLVAESLACAPHDAIELCLSAAQWQTGLSR